MLRHQANAQSGRLARRTQVNRLSPYHNVALIGLIESVEDVYLRGFTRTIFARQHMDLVPACTVSETLSLTTTPGKHLVMWDISSWTSGEVSLSESISDLPRQTGVAVPQNDD